MEAVTLGAAQSYTDEALKGMGALKGKNCTIESITELEKEMEVVFQWTLDDGTVKKESMKVPKGSGSGAEAFIFTFDFEPNGSENPISNLSATYDEIKAAIDNGMTVYGVSTIGGYMYMQFTPTLWMDGMLLFSADNPDGGLPYQLMIESSGNGVVRTGESEEDEDVFHVYVYTGIIEDGTRFIDCDRSYDEINGAFGGTKSVVCKLNVSEQDGTRYDVSLYTRSRVDGTIVFSGKAAPQGVENEYTLTIKYTGEKTLSIEETDEKLRKAVKTANEYTDEQIEKLSTAEALSVDEKPLYEDGKITYTKDGETHTLEDGDTWFYYYDADGALLQTIWIDGTEYTLKAGNVDLKEYLKKTSVVMPKENISDPDPEYKAEDIPSMALLEKLLAENGGGGITGGNPVGTVIAFSGLIPPEGYLLCDGAEVKREDYADLFSVIGELYGAGDGATTFNLPDLTDRFVQGVGTNTLGTSLEAGLPNITGNVPRLDSGGSGAISSSGAFTISQNDAEAANSGSGSRRYNVTFNASKSNDIYGKSNTVQPPSVVMTYIIRAVAGETVENDYVAGEGIEINPTVVDGKEVFEVSSVKQELTITGQLRGNNEIVSLDKTFAEIKAAIEAEKSVTLYIFAEGETENPYVFTPSVILADTINFSLVYGVNAIDMFMLMSVDINSDDTYTVNSKIMQKELVAGDGIELEQTTEDGKNVLAINGTRNFERRQTMPTGADDDLIRPNFLYVDESKGATDEEAALLKRYQPDLSVFPDGFLRYMPVDSFIKIVDISKLFTNMSYVDDMAQNFVLADSILFVNAYFQHDGKPTTASSWHRVGTYDLASLGYNLAIEENKMMRCPGTVYMNGGYINTVFQITRIIGETSKFNMSLYATQDMVGKALGFNLHMMMPVVKRLE